MTDILPEPNQLRIDLAEVRERVAKLAEAFPDQKAVCAYVTRKYPSVTLTQFNFKAQCIVGQALVELGVETTVLYELNNESISNLDFLDRIGVAEFDQSDVQWLTIVQARQDHCHSWSEAVQLADHQVKTGICCSCPNCVGSAR